MMTGKTGRGTHAKPADAVLSALKVGNGLVSLLSGLLAFVLILYSGYVLYDSFATEYRAVSSAQELLKYKPVVLDEKQTEGPSELEAINPDYRAWLTIDDTTIDYPVVQGENDLYYASHDIYRNVSLTGAIYLAAGNNFDFTDSYNLVYGHHMDNGAMFGSLDKFRDSGYFYAHQTGVVISKSGIYDVTLFAVVDTDAYEDQIYRVGNRAKEVISFLEGDRGRDVGLGTKIDIYDAEVAKNAVKVIALSTCASAETNGRLVVFGRMVLRGSDDLPTAQPTVTTTAVTPTPTPTATPTATPTRRPTHAPGKPTPTPTATPTPSPVPTVTLTVHYVANGTEIFPTEVFPHLAGDTYYVVSPQYPGYTAEVEIVQGTITEDMVVYVHYVPNTYHLTIHYIFPDGTEAAETFATDVHTGDSYDVESPVVPGYRPLKIRISGTNPGRDEQYMVIYVPEGEAATLILMEDYETPTALEATYLQIGVCGE